MKTSAPALGTAAKKSPGLSMAKPAAWSSGSGGSGGGISKPAGAGAAIGTTAAKTAVAAEPSPLETDEGMQGFLNANPGYRSNLVDQLFAPTADAKEAAHNLADLVAVATGAGLTSAEGAKVVGRMVDDIHSGTAAADRALLLLQALIAKAGRAVEPFALPLLPRLLQLHADRSNAARDLATSLCATLAGLLSPHTFRTLWPMLTAGMVDDDWRVKCAALQMLKATAPRMSRQLSPLLPDIIPAVSVCIADAKKQVQTLALEALNEACLAITNDDIRHLTPMLVNVIAKPEESEKTLNKLLETTFVSNVDSATLALIAPLLGKVLRNRNTSQLKRKAARVIDNMCRLVREPADVAPFMPLLLPALEKMIDEIVDEEVCSVAKAARGILLKAFGEANATALSREASAATLESAAAEGTAAPPGAAATSTTSVVNPLNLDVQVVKDHLLQALHSMVPGAQPSALMSSVASDVSLEGLNIDEPADRPPPPPAATATATATAVTTGLSGAARTVCEYVATLAAHLVVYDSPGNPAMPLDTAPSAQWRWALAASDPVSWRDCVTHYTAALRTRTGATIAATAAASSSAGGEPPAEDAYGDALAAAFRGAALGDVPDASDEADEDGGNVCDIEFSLAFGGKILLHNARLRLGRGRRYGIMGKNGAGKTTLLTNIGSGNIEGMPPHLKMVYVQHDDRTPDNGLPLMDEIMAGKDIIEANVTRAEVEKALRDIQFTDTMLTSPRSCLSGGWKMKVLIIRAMLVRADILLLDEPTNHLDAASVAWLASYLQAASEVTCLIVSHDIPFLDIVITDVIHYESKKLVYYHGNMTHFVAIHPEAKYYYELVDSTLQFKFPVPERLDGVNSTTRAVLKMDNITYTYPGATIPQLNDVSVKVCLASRIAVLGANGAGKSTLIRLLVQETEPDPGSGEVWKHHNLRVAYVAQHSFHHIEEHLDESPVDYMKWRFGGGVDKEDLARPSMKLTEEEEAADKNRQKQYGDVDKVVGRRKNGKTLEYECTWIGQGEKSVDPRRKHSAKMLEENKYIPLEQMIELGLIKLVQQCDARIAAANAGLDLRPLITAEIQGHLDDFGLEAEFGTHGNIRRMSGGQKVKLVLAAAMWNRPHVLVLDEPTNYLDREALGALTQAIKSFHGGVVIISHNSEFTEALCTESWMVKDGQCIVEGEAEEVALKAAASANNKIRKNKSNNSLDGNLEVTGAATGNTNKEKTSEALPLNPRTLEVLSKKEARYLSRCAQTAGMTLADYVKTINCKSPEWQFLGSFQKN